MTGDRASGPARGLAGSCVALLCAACGPATPTNPDSQPLRQAAFRTASARAFLLTCPGAQSRAEVAAEARRADELTQLAARKGADYPIWAGGNDFGAIARQGPRERCLGGEEAYNEALAAYSGALDDLARRIAEYRR